MNPEQITIVINGVQVSGWLDASVCAGIARIPRQATIKSCFVLNDFLTSNGTDPLSPLELPCDVYVGTDQVISGYICKIDDEMDENSHLISYEVRGATCDLIDSTSEFFGANNPLLTASAKGMTIAQLIAAIANGYDINVLVEKAPSNVPTNANINYPGVISINVGDSAYSAVEQLAKYAGCLVYENEFGDLVLGWPGSEPQSETVLTHQNVKKSNIRYDSSNLYSNYAAYMQSATTNQDSVGSIGFGVRHYDFFDKRKNIHGGKRVRNYRKIFDVSQLPNLYTTSLSPQQIMANYVCNRNAGESQQVTIEVYKWHDEQGVLWKPNQLVRVNLQHQYFNQLWLISEISYNLSDSGTTTQMVLMHPNAFSVEPTPIAQAADQQAVIGDSKSA